MSVFFKRTLKSYTCEAQLRYQYLKKVTLQSAQMAALNARAMALAPPADNLLQRHCCLLDLKVHATQCVQMALSRAEIGALNAVKSVQHVIAWISVHLAMMTA